MLVRVELPDILTDCRGISRCAFGQTTTITFPAFYFFATREHISISSDAERRDEVVDSCFSSVYGDGIAKQDKTASFHPLTHRAGDCVNPTWTSCGGGEGQVVQELTQAVKLQVSQIDR